MVLCALEQMPQPTAVLMQSVHGEEKLHASDFRYLIDVTPTPPASHKIQDGSRMQIITGRCTPWLAAISLRI